MKKLLLALCFIFPHTALNAPHSKTIVIAVIDTGFGYQDLGKKAKLCKYGHKDFTTDYSIAKGYNTLDPIPRDYTGHGTNIAGIIDANIQYPDYCIVIIKYFSNIVGADNLKSSIKAIEYAININADFINYSSYGYDYSKKEANAVKRFLDKGGVFLAAAGNEGRDILINHVYPAMVDSRVITVGNKDSNGKRHLSSNYGPPITIWENGVNLSGFGLIMTGTSQATAKVTGKMVNQRLMDKVKYF